MPKVDFYIISDSNNVALHMTACRVIEKAWYANHSVYVRASSTEEAHQIDELLWVFREQSFIPHRCWQQSMQPNTNEVIIGMGEKPASNFSLLANIAKDIPAFYDQFERIVEFVGTSMQDRSAARERYRGYQKHGCDIQSHNV